ncbi:3-isopropylmalate dehydratase large subunit [bacterium]|nr:3-isopropylmalate dehydratase large subunit [bacterium]MCK4325375.1 3-isopropylmalate dehydratase large subunit [bacterium]MCK4436947.1 3-isopropylmalate dehydratase large subunit [bacterium]
MTITEKILAAHAGRKEVEPGEFIEAKADLLLANDITGPLAIKELGDDKVFDPERIALVPDHFTPNKDAKSAEQCRILKEFAKKHRIKHYFEVGRMGIEHALLPEKGLVQPGELIIGADSHTCTYGALGAFASGVGSTDLAACMLSGRIWLKVPESIKLIYYGKLKKWVTGKDLILYTIGDLGVDGANYKAMEFHGEVISQLSMDGRFTMANMAVEAGAKNGIFQPDEITLNYVQQQSPLSADRQEYTSYKSDEDATYAEIREYDCSKIKPQVALPPLPSNTKPVAEAGDINIDQAVIGSCTNGRMEDLRLAAQVLRGHKIHPYVRLIIIPATQKIYLQALQEGLIEIFIEAGAVVTTPTCGPCLGGHMGVLAEGEKAIATTNRNFTGRMGHPRSEVYLANPAVAAASALKGRITHP